MKSIDRAHACAFTGHRPEKLMVKDVADILRISVASAYHLVKADGFPVLLLNGQMRIEKEAFISWMRGKERK